MATRLVVAVGVAAGCAAGGVVGAWVLAGAGTQPSGRLGAVTRGSSGLPAVQQWARSASASARTVASRAGSACRQVASRVRGGHDPQDVAAGAPATSGGVIPLETVPIDRLSEWELDLLTTPDP